MMITIVIVIEIAIVIIRLVGSVSADALIALVLPMLVLGIICFRCSMICCIPRLKFTRRCLLFSSHLVLSCLTTGARAHTCPARPPARARTRTRAQTHKHTNRDLHRSQPQTHARPYRSGLGCRLPGPWQPEPAREKCCLPGNVSEHLDVPSIF